jgi:small subunit ribosomal protein S6
MDYVGSPDLVAEVERNMRLDDRILKYLTVKLTDSIDPESIKEIPPESEPETESEPVAEPEEAVADEVKESEEES